MDRAFDHPWLAAWQVDEVLAARDAESRIERLATHQGGVVDRPQTVAIGLSERSIDRRVDATRFVPLHPGVYAVGHEALTPRGRAIAALLAVPSGALSHRTAGAIREVCVEVARVEVTPMCGQVRSRDALKAYRCRLLDDDVEIVHGLRVTKLPRTLLDLAETVPLTELFRAVREARVKHGLTHLELEDVIARHPGRRGIKALRQAMGDPAAEPTKSWAERRLAGAIRRSPLPQPAFNEVFAGKQRDVVWKRERLVVEVDDYWTHGDPLSFEDDRSRDNTLAMEDVEVRRVTKRAIRDDIVGVLVLVAYRLGARAGSMRSELPT